jgi:hypothetical protein
MPLSPRPLSALVSLLLLGLLAPRSDLAAQAQTVLNDTFADNDYTNQALPASARWFYAGGGDTGRVSAASGALTYTVPVGSTNTVNFLLAHLTDGRPVVLDEWDTLRVSFKVTLSSVRDITNSFRVALYDSRGNRLSGPVNTTPFPVASSLYNTYNGYQFVVNPGGPAADIAIARRHARTDGGNLFTGQVNLPGTANTTAFTPTPGVPFDVVIDLGLYSGTLTLDYTFNGVRITRSESYPFTSFDTLALFGSSGLLNPGESVTFDDIRVVHTSANPSSGIIYGTHSLTDNQGLAATFYTPSAHPVPGRKYTVLLGVHGVITDDWNGDGVVGNAGDYETAARGAASGLREHVLADPNLIALGIPFQPGTNRGAFQNADEFYCQNVADVLAQIERAGWPLQPRILVDGFSGGAQFAHRFALRYPGRVFAVAAHSAGGWATTTSSPAITTAARSVDFFVTCGEADTSRVAGAATFATTLANLGFRVSHFTWPGVGHDIASNGVVPTVHRDGLGLTRGGLDLHADVSPNTRRLLAYSDADGDGLPLVLEHALGLDPFVAQPPGFLSPTVVDGRLQLSFSRPAGQPKLRLVAEGSSDLATWTTLARTDATGRLVALLPGVDVIETGSGTLQNTVRDVPGAPRRFMRLRAEMLRGGLRARFYANNTFTTAPAATRVEPVNYAWGTGRPTSAVPLGSFAARFEGMLEPATTGSHVLRTVTDGGVRLWLDGELLIDRWTDKGLSTDLAPARTLEAGRSYALRMEFYADGGNSEARLQWQPPGASSFTTLPVSSLTPAPTP